MRSSSSSPLARRVLLAAALFGSLPAAGQALNGGAGLPHTRPAWVLENGQLTSQMGARFWGQAAEQSYAPWGAPGKRNIWDLQSALALNYGLGAHLEAQITPVLYQSDQSGGGRFGHDLSATMAVGSLQWPSRSIFLGAAMTAHFPTGVSHNLLFESYSPARHAVTLTGLASYAADPEFPAEAISGHLNAGYTLFDDTGLQFHNQRTGARSFVVERSQKLTWSTGLALPGAHFDFGVEGYGQNWIRQPAAGAEGREDFAYASLSLRYKPLRWCHLSLAIDRRLSSDTDETIPTMAERGLGELPNYPSWLLQLGLHLKLLPLHFLQTSDEEVIMKRGEARAPVFEKIIGEESNKEAGRDDLDRLRAEKERAEKELERLRRVIETRQQEEKKPSPDQNL